jgi:hypothetical protein
LAAKDAPPPLLGAAIILLIGLISTVSAIL